MPKVLKILNKVEIITKMAKRLKIKTGDVFNRLTAIEEVKSVGKGQTWKFKCECGNEKISTVHNVYRGNIKACGCHPKGPVQEDLVGKKFNMLVVIEFSRKYDTNRYYWKCLCDCGNETEVRGDKLKDSTTRSCGCFEEQSKKNPNNTLTHQQCYLCKEIKELNKNNFTKHKQTLSGFRHLCNICATSGKERLRHLRHLLFGGYYYGDNKKGLTSDISLDFILDFLKEGVACYSCDIKQNESLSVLGLDRIDNLKGHLKDNVLPCCTKCNRTRGDRFTVEEMKEEIGPSIRRIREKEGIIPF